MDKKIIKEMRNAIKNDELDLVRELILNNEGLLDVNTIFGSWLHVAASQGKRNIVEYLIECGMDVNIEGDISGGNPIRSAAESGHLDIVKLLYQKGARLDVSKVRKNPLFGAIYGGYYEVVKFLVEHGIDIVVCYSIGQLDKVDAYEYAKQYGQIQIANYLKSKLEETRRGINL